MLSRQGAPDAVALYRTLRRINPAPYAGGLPGHWQFHWQGHWQVQEAPAALPCL